MSWYIVVKRNPNCKEKLCKEKQGEALELPINLPPGSRALGCDCKNKVVVGFTMSCLRRVSLWDGVRSSAISNSLESRCCFAALLGTSRDGFSGWSGCFLDASLGRSFRHAQEGLRRAGLRTPSGLRGELVEVAWKRAIWVSLLRGLPPWPRSVLDNDYNHSTCAQIWFLWSWLLAPKDRTLFF